MDQDEKRIKVLLVEDNSINQQITCEFLQSMGMSVDIAKNGLEAVEKINDDKQLSYDIVLMDIQMPELNGIDATIEIRKNPLNNSLPIVAMTAYTMISDKNKCIEFGMNDYITKPIDYTKLTRIIETWIKSEKKKYIINPETTLNKNNLIEYVELLPYIDFEELMKRISGNIAILMNLFKNFFNDYHDYGNKIFDAIQDKNYEKARILVHELKGVAGNLSAFELEKNSILLEKAIIQKKSDDIQRNYNFFTGSLNTLLLFTSNIEIKKEINNNEPNNDYTISEIKNIINILESKIDCHDVSAEKEYNKLKDIINLKEMFDDIKILGDSLDIFDFQGAKLILNKIKRSFN